MARLALGYPLGLPKDKPKLVPHALCGRSEGRAGRKAGWWSVFPQTVSWLLPGQYTTAPNPCSQRAPQIALCRTLLGMLSTHPQAASSCQGGPVMGLCVVRYARGAPIKALKHTPGDGMPWFRQQRGISA